MNPTHPVRSAEAHRWLWHAAIPEEWTAAHATGTYAISTRGHRLDEVGFVHCSRLNQLEAVANRFYGDVPVLTVLVIDPDLVGAEVIDEPPIEGSDERFPHVYGPIPVAAVVTTLPWRRSDDGFRLDDL